MRETCLYGAEWCGTNWTTSPRLGHGRGAPSRHETNDIMIFHGGTVYNAEEKWYDTFKNRSAPANPRWQYIHSSCNCKKLLPAQLKTFKVWPNAATCTTSTTSTARFFCLQVATANLRRYVLLGIFSLFNLKLPYVPLWLPSVTAIHGTERTV